MSTISEQAEAYVASDPHLMRLRANVESLRDLGKVPEHAVLPFPRRVVVDEDAQPNAFFTGLIVACSIEAVALGLVLLARWVGLRNFALGTLLMLGSALVGLALYRAEVGR
jgi:hypothetical protein